MFPDVTIIHSSIDDNILTLEFTSGETGAAFYLEYDIIKEDFEEISVAEKDAKFYFKTNWDNLSLTNQRIIDNIVFEILNKK
jgi:hypothetical protein